MPTSGETNISKQAEDAHGWQSQAASWGIRGVQLINTTWSLWLATLTGSRPTQIFSLTHSVLLLLTFYRVCVCVFATQSCPTLCDPVSWSLQGSSVQGTLQARILEWVVIPFSRGSSDPGIEPGSPTLQADPIFYYLGVFLLQPYRNST